MKSAGFADFGGCLRLGGAVFLEFEIIITL